jgi:hypothetical protein
MEHPTRADLLRFLLGTTSRQENRLIVRHLLANCPACTAALSQMWKEPIAPTAYDQALDRFQEQLRTWLSAKPSQRTLLSNL